jgi:penicillin amidase
MNFLAAGCGDEVRQRADTTDAADLADAADSHDVTDATGPADSVDGDATDTRGEDANAAQAAILGVPETGSFKLAGLSAPVQVVRTEGSTPHLYAESREDLARVLGLVQARDRFFFMDLQRRLGLGTLSALLGAAGLERDLESRGTGMAFVTDKMVSHLSPAFRAYLEAFAAGVNAYIEGVRNGTELPPTEAQFAGLLGFDSPADMLEPFTVRDVVALVTVFMYNTNFETDDLGRTAAARRLETQFAGKTDEALRTAGFLAEFWDDITPLFPGTNSTPGFADDKAADRAPSAGPRRPSHALAQHLPKDLLERLHARLDSRMQSLGRDRDAGFGSNLWGVAGTHTKDGAALFANDGHLELSVPPLGYGAALDTRVFGGGDIHQLGGWLGNFPVMVGGTNGNVAWGGVNPVIDISDFYREVITLDANGRPAFSQFQGASQPLVASDETFVVADIALLDSVGRTETWTRWTTFDGRWLIGIEGRPANGVADAGPGETVVTMLGDLIVPADIDGDGVIEGISFDYVALDATRWPEALFEVGLGDSVEDVREATRGYVGAALFTGAADKSGSILYSSYQAVPCRGYLPREDGRFADGADPTMILDGTRYGGFTIPTDADGKSDEGPGATDPYRCVIGHDTMPYVIDPPSGFIYNANNDPAGLMDDGDERNDLHYIGGPWGSVRGDTIHRDLVEATARKATLDDMKATQANIDSRLGELFVPQMVASVAYAKGLSGTLGADDARIRSRYEGHAAALDEAVARLEAWGARGFVAHGGVETFYAAPTADERKDAVATMIFNAAYRRLLALVYDDEGFSAERWGREARSVNLIRYFAGRGAGNPGGLASWNAATGESVFFDVVGTPEVERGDELVVRALVEALDFLASAPSAPGVGGFGTTDMDAWLWGLRHTVRFESILNAYVGGSAALSIITDMFSISTERIPLADGLAPGDPRLDLKWFPRGGDQWSVDASNPGLSGTDFTYGFGPAMRIVYALKDGAVEGGFVLPGGQSALTDSPYFDDQTRLWLGNRYQPMHFAPADVAAHAIGREVYRPE